MTWTMPDPLRKTILHPEALSDAMPLLQQLVAAFGLSATARLLGVPSEWIANCRTKRWTIDRVYVRVHDMHDVLTRALQSLEPTTVMTWLVSYEPFLNHRRPIDVFGERGRRAAANRH